MGRTHQQCPSPRLDPPTRAWSKGGASNAGDRGGAISARVQEKTIKPQGAQLVPGSKAGRSTESILKQQSIPEPPWATSACSSQQLDNKQPRWYSQQQQSKFIKNRQHALLWPRHWVKIPQKKSTWEIQHNQRNVPQEATGSKGVIDSIREVSETGGGYCWLQQEALLRGSLGWSVSQKIEKSYEIWRYWKCSWG